jgi:hypothetical protein
MFQYTILVSEREQPAIVNALFQWNGEVQPILAMEAIKVVRSKPTRETCKQIRKDSNFLAFCNTGQKINDSLRGAPYKIKTKNQK